MKSFVPLRLVCWPEKGANTDTEKCAMHRMPTPFFSSTPGRRLPEPKAGAANHREPSGACPAAGRVPRRLDHRPLSALVFDRQRCRSTQYVPSIAFEVARVSRTEHQYSSFKPN
jgi:hypothetical protein